jgi:2-desacetyl-2-hydroxyethyl bacteriochlorophyllide A dehydrogenase
MKAVVCSAPGQLEIVDRPAPGALATGQIRLAVSHIGICGTDYHIYEGKHPFLEYPRVMGHEISAHVREVASGSEFHAGDLVIVNPYISCGKCIACRRGKPNCCVAIRVLGVHADGAFCEEIVVPEENVYPANGLRPEQAATVEFLAIGAHAVRRAGPAEKGAGALVIGAGPIGLGTALFARIAGYDVTLMDVSQERLEAAAGRFGFAKAIVVSEAALKTGMEMTSGEGFEAVFDATGNAGSMNAALPFVAHGGALVFVSVVKDDIIFADPEFHKREMMIIGSRNALKADFEHVVSCIASGAIDTNLLITHRTDFESVVADLPRWAHEKTGLIKAIIQAQA